jgi:V8-like Glu-specific endopeptidase
MYANGEWATKNYKKAKKWFMKAAEQGHIGAQLTLAKMYLYGIGVRADNKIAFNWYMKAAVQGDSEAQYMLGDIIERYGNMTTLYEDKEKKALKWYMKAAKQNHPSALRSVGDMYHDGKGGLRRNHQKALQYYLEAARNGDIGSMSLLGYAYLKGEGAIRQNYIKAYAWLSLAHSKTDPILKSLSKTSETLDMIEEKMTTKQLAIAQRYNPLKTINSSEKEKKNVKSSKTFTGTGFFINTSSVVTNHHVVEECSSIEIVRGEYRTSAKIVVDDSRNDLAVLKAKTANETYLKLRAGKSIRIGQEVIVLGYPLGKLLGSGIKLTSGDVSSLTGLVDDATNMQITAPVQPGNSGGPLLDKSGNLVGVIYSRVEKTLSGRSTQNVNLAIKSNILQMLLDTNNIDYNIALSKEKKEAADIADEAKGSVVQVLCHQ